MKFKISFAAVMIILLYGVSAISAAANGGVSWYIKRAGQNCPAIEESQKIIEKYNGIYADKKSSEEGRKIIYLTFDAGYENGNVKKIVDTLDKNGIKASFFLLDNIIIKNSDLVKSMADSGHLICNHTKNHKDLTKCTDEQIEENVLSLEKIYEDKIGGRISKFFRFPEGKYNEASLKKISELGYKSVFWSFAYADWDNAKQPDPKHAVDLILKNTHPGEIMLLHPTSSTNAEILPKLIEEWRNMGYEFGLLDEIKA